MAFVSAHNTVISYDNSSGTPVDLSAYINSINGVDLTNEMLDTTAFGNTSKAAIRGLKGGNSITISGDWDATLHAHMIAVDALTTGATQTLTYNPAGTGSSTPYISVETQLESYNPASQVGDKVVWSATLRMTGNTTTGTN